MDEKSSTSLPKSDQEQSPAITLRRIELSDVDDMMVWLTDDRVSRYTVWDTYTSREQALDYIKNLAIPHPWTKAICIDNKAVGAISVTPNSGIDKCRAELGYVLAHGFWGKGIMTKAVKMVVSTIFEEWLFLERLEAVVNVNNKGSQKVCEKSGFCRDGVLRKYKIIKGSVEDAVIFSFLRDRSHE